jgi:hypothetical protein
MWRGETIVADNPNLELAQAIMIERFGLEETKYSLVSFSEGSKGITIKMSDGFVPVAAMLPNELLEFEKVRKMVTDEKRAYFVLLQPKWDKVPMEVRELFDDVVEEWEIGEVPQLRQPVRDQTPDEEETKQPNVVDSGKATLRPVPKARPVTSNGVAANKPVLKPRGVAK